MRKHEKKNHVERKEMEEKHGNRKNKEKLKSLHIKLENWNVE